MKLVVCLWIVLLTRVIESYQPVRKYAPIRKYLHSLFQPILQSQRSEMNLFARNKKVDPEPDLVVDDELMETFKQWEEEEIENYKIESEEARNRLDEEDNFMNQDLPDYMLKMLNEYLPAEEDTPVPQSKLPSIVVFGRPNTGKSTLVNRLTNSYKVS